MSYELRLLPIVSLHTLHDIECKIFTQYFSYDNIGLGWQQPVGLANKRLTGVNVTKIITVKKSHVLQV